MVLLLEVGDLDNNWNYPHQYVHDIYKSTQDDVVNEWNVFSVCFNIQILSSSKNICSEPMMWLIQHKKWKPWYLNMKMRLHWQINHNNKWYLFMSALPAINNTQRRFHCSNLVETVSQRCRLNPEVVYDFIRDVRCKLYTSILNLWHVPLSPSSSPSRGGEVKAPSTSTTS